MSKKPKRAFDLRPTDGDTLTTEGYTPIDYDDGNASARSDTQLANVISNRLGNPSIVPPVSGTYSAVIQDNQTQATYNNNFTGSYDRHFATITGATPSLTTDGLAGPATGVIELGDYLPHSLDIWTGVLGDPPTTIAWTPQTPAEDDGTGGFAVQANDTLEPSTITDFAGTTTGTSDPTTEIIYTWSAATDSGSGMDRYDLYQDNDGQQTLLVSDVTSGVTLSGRTPSGIFTAFVRAYDSSGNFSASNRSTVQLDAATSAGTINFDDSGIPAKSQAESTATFSLGLTLTGNTDGQQKTCRVFIREYEDVTFENGASNGQITIPGAGHFVATFNSGNSYATTVAITISDIDTLQNNYFEVYIDADTLNDDSGVGNNPSVGSNNKLLCELTGTGTVEGVEYVEYAAGGGEDVIVLDADMSLIQYRTGSVKSDDWELEDYADTALVDDTVIWSGSPGAAAQYLRVGVN